MPSARAGGSETRFGACLVAVVVAPQSARRLAELIGPTVESLAEETRHPPPDGLAGDRWAAEVGWDLSTVEGEMDITEEDLYGKAVLEVGSGRGGTTRKLVDAMCGQRGASLIVTDLSDAHFERLREAFKGAPLRIRFVRTGARELAGIDKDSVDYLVCNYTLCAINAQPGEGVLALHRFREVLKSGGRLFVEEEFAIDGAETPRQELWAEKWRILKSMTLAAGRAPYTEFAPDMLADLCRSVGFRDVKWTASGEVYEGVEVLDFFEQRLERLLAEMPSKALRAGFRQWAVELKKKAERVGGMEIPYYRLTARKVVKPEAGGG